MTDTAPRPAPPPNLGPTCHGIAAPDRQRSRLPPFAYVRAETVEHAWTLLRDQPGARLVAGGTDLLVKLNRRAISATLLVGIQDLDALLGVSCARTTGLRIGAATRLVDVAEHEAIRSLVPAVAEAAEHTATVQIRNMGSIGGNICNASPCADNVPALVALEAEADIMGPDGERALLLEDLLAGPGQTTLQRDELLVAVRARLPGRMGLAYERLAPRSRVDVAAASVAACVGLGTDGSCAYARIVLGAVGPTVFRAMAAEQVLVGNELAQDSFEQAAALAADAARPIDDVRASADYRRAMIGVLCRRALISATQRAQGRGGVHV